MSENTDRSLADVAATDAMDATLASAPQPAPEKPERRTLKDLLSGSSKVRRTATICPDGGLILEADAIRVALAHAREKGDEAAIADLKANHADVIARRDAAVLTFTLEGRTPEWVRGKRAAGFRRFGIEHTVDKRSGTITADVTAPEFMRVILGTTLEQVVKVTAADGEVLDIDDLDVDTLLSLRECIPGEVEKLNLAAALANGEGMDAALNVDF